MTLQEARISFKACLEDGTICPCCGRFGKLYERPLYNRMAEALIVLYWKSRRRYIHVESELKKLKNASTSIRGDFAKLRYWGLIKPHPDRRGYWRITIKGMSFVRNRSRIPRAAIMLNKKLFGFSGQTINIVEALGEKFDYDELMGRLGNGGK